MSGIHINSDKPVYVSGDMVAGDKITTVIGAADHIPRDLLEQAEELVVDAEALAFGEARDLIKALRAVRSAFRAQDKPKIKQTLDGLEAMPGSQIITIVVKEIRKKSEQ